MPYPFYPTATDYAAFELAEIMDSRGIVPVSVVPVALVSAAMPEKLLEPLLADFCILEVCEALAISPEQLKAESSVTGTALGALALILRERLARGEVDTGALLVRYLYPRDGGGYGSQIILASNLYYALCRLVEAPSGPLDRRPVPEARA